MGTTRIPRILFWIDWNHSFTKTNCKCCGKDEYIFNPNQSSFFYLNFSTFSICRRKLLLEQHSKVEVFWWLGWQWRGFLFQRISLFSNNVKVDWLCWLCVICAKYLVYLFGSFWFKTEKMHRWKYRRHGWTISKSIFACGGFVCKATTPGVYPIAWLDSNSMCFFFVTLNFHCRKLWKAPEYNCSTKQENCATNWKGTNTRFSVLSTTKKNFLFHSVQ